MYDHIEYDQDTDTYYPVELDDYPMPDPEDYYCSEEQEAKYAEEYANFYYTQLEKDRVPTDYL